MVRAARRRAAMMQPTIMPARAAAFESPELLDTAVVVTLEDRDALVEEGLVDAGEEEVVEAVMVGTVLASTATPRANPSYG
jgi:hypothetical protein